LGGRLLVILIVLMLSLGPLAQTSGSDGQGEDRGPGPLDASEVWTDSSEVWTDSFDDLSHVFMQTNVVVVSREVRLATGKDQGWIASEVIPAKDGYRYDFVLLEATTPGNSSVEITILDATEEASVIGYANETITPFENVEGVYLSLKGLDTTLYPEIRVQVNLVEDATDRPTLQAWSLYYVPRDEWRDEFLGDWKMSEEKGINHTGDMLEINLSRPSQGSAEYDAYPAVFFSCQGVDSLSAYYPNPTRTGYEDEVEETGASGNWATHFDDMNKDGYLDMIVTSYDSDSEIRWGDGTGSWSSTGAEKMNANGGYQIATGDFDNDGWPDIAFACTQGGNNKVFLNQGNGDSTVAPAVQTPLRTWSSARLEIPMMLTLDTSMTTSTWMSHLRQWDRARSSSGVQRVRMTSLTIPSQRVL